MKIIIDEDKLITLVFPRHELGLALDALIGVARSEHKPPELDPILNKAVESIRRIYKLYEH